MIKTVTTTTGVNTVTFPEFFKYFWIKNIGDTTAYASAFANVSAGVDNTSVIKSGDTVCVENIDNDNVYISGEGSVEIHAQNYADCPFKVGGKGGESPDLSAYAKKTDIPTELPANGGNADYAENAGNADTVGGKSKDDFVGAMINNGERFLMMNGDHTTITQIFDSTVPNAPAVSNFCHVIGINGEGNVTVALSIGKDYTRDVYTYSASNAQWKNICEKPYIKGSATVLANSTTCISNHGFTPSAVIWWDGNSSGVAVSLNDTQFAINNTSAVDRTINYLIFK